MRDLREPDRAFHAAPVTAVTLATLQAEIDATALPGGVIDLAGKILAINAAAARLLARPPSEVIGRMVWEFAPGFEYLWAERLEAARDPGGRTFEIAIATPLGALMLEYAVIVHELERQTAVVAFVLKSRPLT